MFIAICGSLYDYDVLCALLGSCYVPYFFRDKVEYTLMSCEGLVKLDLSRTKVRVQERIVCYLSSRDRGFWLKGIRVFPCLGSSIFVCVFWQWIQLMRELVA